MPDDIKPDDAPRTFTQEQVNQFLAAEKRKATERYADYDALKDKASKFDDLDAQTKSDLQKAQERAEAAERRAQESDRRYTAQQVQTALTGALTGRTVPPMSLIGLDLTQFVKDGTVDNDAIATYADQFEKSTTTTTVPVRTTFGQGPREPIETKPGDRGRAEAERRFGGSK